MDNRPAEKSIPTLLNAPAPLWVVAVGLALIWAWCGVYLRAEVGARVMPGLGHIDSTTDRHGQSTLATLSAALGAHQAHPTASSGYQVDRARMGLGVATAGRRGTAIAWGTTPPPMRCERFEIVLKASKGELKASNKIASNVFDVFDLNDANEDSKAQALHMEADASAAKAMSYKRDNHRSIEAAAVVDLALCDSGARLAVVERKHGRVRGSNPWGDRRETVACPFPRIAAS